MCFFTLTLSLSLKGEGILFLVIRGVRALLNAFAYAGNAEALW